jgi:hypothetical protein
VEQQVLNDNQRVEQSRRTISSSADKGASETVRRVIDELGNNYSMVKIETTLFEVSTILTYLAQCDYAQGEAASDLESDESFGRHYLMQMLGRCVHHFHENGEETAGAVNHLHNVITEKDREVSSLLQLHKHYKELIEYSETNEKAKGDELALLKSSILAIENNLSLQKSPALAHFKRVAEAQEEPTKKAANFS